MHAGSIIRRADRRPGLAARSRSRRRPASGSRSGPGRELQRGHRAHREPEQVERPRPRRRRTPQVVDQPVVAEAVRHVPAGQPVSARVGHEAREAPGAAAAARRSPRARVTSRRGAGAMAGRRHGPRRRCRGRSPGSSARGWLLPVDVWEEGLDCARLSRSPGRVATISAWTPTPRPRGTGTHAWNATRWARWRSRRTRSTAPRPSARSSTSRSPASGCPRAFLRALALDQAGGRRDQRRPRPARRRPKAAGDRRRRGRGRRRPATTTQFPHRRLPDRLGHLDQHEHERGRRPPRRGALRSAARRSTPTTTSTAASRSNDVIPTALQLSGAVAIEEELLPALDRAPGALAAKADEFWRRRQDRPHAPPGRDADPARPGVPRLRGPGRGVDPAGAGAAQAELLTVPLGGTAVGTGINAHPEFAARSVRAGCRS